VKSTRQEVTLPLTGGWPPPSAWPATVPDGEVLKGSASGGRLTRVVTVVLRVVFADDNFLVREGVSALLAEVEGIEVAATVADAPSLIRAVVEHSPDAVLTDIRMPPSHTNEGIEAAKRIRAEHPGVGVVVLSQYVEEDYAFELLADGVAGMGYLLKERVSDVEELARALHQVVRGGSVLDPLVVEALLARRSGHGPLLGLTEREREVLEQMATGRTNAAIAKALFMSDRAVEKHIGAVFLKLGLVDEHALNRRVSAVLAYLEASSARP
jgi:DNA-binding NarL/FixJ family response regulator